MKEEEELKNLKKAIKNLYETRKILTYTYLNYLNNENVLQLYKIVDLLLEVICEVEKEIQRLKTINAKSLNTKKTI